MKTMSKDEQEALSLRYGNNVIIVLPLSSGNWAIFDNSRQLKTIVPFIDLRKVLNRLKPKIAKKLKQKPRQSSPIEQPSAPTTTKKKKKIIPTVKNTFKRVVISPKRKQVIFERAMLQRRNKEQ